MWTKHAQAKTLVRGRKNWRDINGLLWANCCLLLSWLYKVFRQTLWAIRATRSLDVLDLCQPGWQRWHWTWSGYERFSTEMLPDLNVNLQQQAHQSHWHRHYERSPFNWAKEAWEMGVKSERSECTYGLGVRQSFRRLNGIYHCRLQQFQTEWARSCEYLAWPSQKAMGTMSVSSFLSSAVSRKHRADQLRSQISRTDVWVNERTIFCSQSYHWHFIIIDLQC